MEYGYSSADAPWADYLWVKVIPLIPPRTRVFEIGSGNGALVRKLRELGHEAMGVDTSQSGVALSEHCFVGSAYDDLAATYGKFPVVVSLEVIEHLMEPRRFLRTAYDLLEPNGMLILSTPFHGYWKNLALSALGKMDEHFNSLWDGGHVKFFSERTLAVLLGELGLDARFTRAGRIPPFAKSVIAIASRTSDRSSEI